MMNDEQGELPVLPLFAGRSWAVAGQSLRLQTGPVPKPEVTEGLELFQAPPPAAEADGYAVWKSEVAAQRAAEEARRRSAELPVHAGEDGFARWKGEAEAARLAFEQRWGVPLGKPVRVQLRGELREREGLLRVAEEAAVAGAGRPLRLTLGGHVFAAGEIESVVRV